MHDDPSNTSGSGTRQGFLASGHVRRNRLFLICLVVLSILPLGAAVWLYYGSPGLVAGSQTNLGALLDPPAVLEQLELQRDDASLLVPGEERVWRLVAFPGSRCDTECFDALVLLRQVHILLGRDEDRVMRLAALPTGGHAGPLRQQLAEQLPGMATVTTAEGALAEVLAQRQLRGRRVPQFEAGAPEQGVLIVDPLGNVILYHALDQIGSDLLSDLKQLLRLSNIG